MIYDIAGLRVYLHTQTKYIERYCEEYLSQDQFSPADIHASVTQEEFEKERDLTGRFPDFYIENACMYRSICRQLPAFNRMVLHGSVLDYNGDGYAFLAKSGVGKTTHTNLWLNNFEGALVVNGDKPILHFDGEKAIAYGTPWMGKERQGANTSVPLKALCFIERAKENEMVALSTQDALKRLFLQVLWPEDEEDAKRTLQLLDRLVSNTKSYLLKCNVSIEAARLSFDTMTNKG